MRNNMVSWFSSPYAVTTCSFRLYYNCVPRLLEAQVEAFCQAVQRYSPVGSSILPIPGVTPGYGDEVIFADGTFVDGSTLELSADGPLREPFAAYLQGGTHWTHWKIVLEEALRSILTELDEE
eukprot:5468388-Pleurochrysis_carterae.AAC.4